MAIWKNILGTMNSYFKIGGNSAPRIKNNSGVLEIKNTGDTDFDKLRANRIQSSNGINDVPVLVDAMSKVILFSFAGGSAPAAGSNTGKFGFCHTTGGSYTANDVVYDTGSALLVIPREMCKVVFTTDAVSGTVSFNADGVYAWEGSGYVIKGDGTSSITNSVRAIEVGFDYSDGTVSSTASIPEGARVLEVKLKVSTAFDGSAPTVVAVVDGTSDETIMTTAQNDLKTVGEYIVEDTVAIDASHAGVVKLTVTPDSSSNGVASIMVLYVVPSA